MHGALEEGRRVRCKIGGSRGEMIMHVAAEIIELTFIARARRHAGFGEHHAAFRIQNHQLAIDPFIEDRPRPNVSRHLFDQRFERRA